MSDAPGAGSGAPADPIELRRRAFHVPLAITNPSTSHHPDVLGVVADLPATAGHVTVVALCDGTAQLLREPPEPSITGPSTFDVVMASSSLLIAAQIDLDLVPLHEDRTSPPPGALLIHVRTTSGERSTDVDAADVRTDTEHPLHRVIERVLALDDALERSTVDPDAEEEARYR